MAIGASLWATALHIRERCRDHKDAHIGCQWGYGQLVIETDSPIFHLVRHRPHRGELARRHHGEPDRQAVLERVDGGYDFIAAAMAHNGDPNKLNGGGPIWAIFDADAVVRERWNPKPPNVDPRFFREWCDGEGTGGQHQQSVPEEADAGMSCRRLSSSTTPSSPRASTATSRSPNRCSRSRNRRSMRHGRLDPP